MKTAGRPGAARSGLIEISLRASNPSAEQLLRAVTFLAACGAPAGQIVRTQTRTAARLAVYVEGARRAARFRRRFASDRPKGWALRSRFLRESDWLTKWQTGYRIGPLGRRLDVVPLWRRREYRGRKIPVYIDPRGAFGSGTHETTRLVVRWMEKLSGRFDSFLDVGTGTGILLIAAKKLGAARLVGLDEDPRALETARINLRHNGVKGAELVRADARRRRVRGSFGLVAANLLSSVLVEASARLAASVKPGGHLIVSGIERVNLPWYDRRFRDGRLRRVGTLKGRRWASALYRRKAPAE